ncbi:MAG TPA: DNA methyltransferase [Pseudobacteroides sp.]|nr:DNA methyltransferase [Pseudobacteroides sp.]
MAKKFKCPHCEHQCTKTEYPEHLKEEHIVEYQKVINDIKNYISNNYNIKETAAKVCVTERFVKKVVINKNIIAKEEQGAYKINKLKVKVWEPENFNLETTTIWGFPDRGSWATHTGKYRGNWSPYIPRNIILRYSNEGDIVLDQFVGSGTTIVEAKLLGRKGIGVDINPDSVRLTLANVNFNFEGCGTVEVHNGDARNLYFIKSESVDLICTHPPYADIIKYSNNIVGDLSHYDINNFLKEMECVCEECFRVLKKGKFCAILIGDTRKKGHILPLGFNVMQVFSNSGFSLKEIIIKEQHNCRSTAYWRNKSIKYNFFLIAHEYLFVFKKP